MDLYNIITKIPYIIMLIVGLTVILGLYIGGLNSLELEIDDSAQKDYRQAVVLENLINIEASESELANTVGESYYYDRKRARIPIEFFTNEDPSVGEIGFREVSGNCYINDATGLNGVDFAFAIESPDGNPFDDPDFSEFSQECLYLQPGSATSSALLIRESEDKAPLEVIIHVFPV